MKNTDAILVFLASLVFLLHSSFPLHFAEAQGNETPYTYIEATGRGPSRRGQLNPELQACGNGRMQSPIDIRLQDVKLAPALGDLPLQYQPAAASIKSLGRVIQVSWKGNAGNIIVNGDRYDLKQCHWHIPTEHAIEGIRYDLELHIVHQNSDGAFAVVAILFKLGRPDQFLSRLLPFIKSVTKEEKDLGIINPRDIGFWSRNYFRYNGSLTAPPCSEGVVWTIFQEVIMVSEEQVNALRDAVDNEFKMNARPIQALNGRSVFLYQAI
ncbi:alpha carbonic anhydrase 4 [Manihot esculenta]|uniref:Alpha-carbonic anhydrase domain-containing protein n=1 Tax=Manihot esculenta TaxID=3983 RepID=A0A2C9V754_MANES|nr:alpha carbonic anhydrase 4 [Manihot esculenta]OAY40380.1 hypothetical protein MANES_09G017600v8 [Manihot esculenta]